MLRRWCTWRAAPLPKRRATPARPNVMYRAALDVDPISFDGGARLLDLLVASGRACDALPAIERAAGLAADSARLAALLGEARLAVRDASGAEVALRRALKLAPDGEATRLALGRALLMQQRPAEAIAIRRPSVRHPIATCCSARRIPALATGTGIGALAGGARTRARDASTLTTALRGQSCSSAGARKPRRSWRSHWKPIPTRRRFAGCWTGFATPGRGETGEPVTVDTPARRSAPGSRRGRRLIVVEPRCLPSAWG